MFAIIVGLFEEQKAVDEADRGEYRAPPKSPFPAHADVDKSGYHWSEFSAHRKGPAIQSHVLRTLMGEPDIGDGDFCQRFNRAAEETEKDAIGQICSRGCAKRRSSEDDHVSKEGNKIDWPFAVLQGKCLPQNTAPAVEQELVDQCQ